VSKHPLKEVKASGGCHGIGKEFFVQAQSRFRTQLCRGIIDYSIINVPNMVIKPEGTKFLL